MDLILFSTVPRPITAEVFAEWPEHMRREFALLVAEHPEQTDARVQAATGITPAALNRARESKGLFALNFSEARVLGEEDDVGSATHRASRRAGWKRRRIQDA